MEFDGVQAEHQALRDLLVGETFGHQLKDLALSLTQRLKGRREWCWERRNSGPGSSHECNRCLDALKVDRRGGGKRGHPREQVCHHLSCLGKRGQIAFLLGWSGARSHG